MKYTNLKIESKQWSDLIIQGGNIFGVSISTSQLYDIRTHAMELLKWNKVFNLTSITKPLDIAVKHFLDSLAAVPFINKNAKILDIGSGAGFPGIPLRIALPHSSVTLMESSRRKTSFLKYLSQTLEFDNVSIVHAHCEHLINFDSYKNLFDVVICRALTNLRDFIRISLPFLSEKGTIIALKGKVNKNNVTIDGIKLNTKFTFANNLFSIKSHSYYLPILGASRNIIFVRHAL